MFLSKLRSLSAYSKLSLFSLLLLSFAGLASVSLSLNEQHISSNAWNTSQSASVSCNGNGAIITASFTNTETNTALGMNVNVKDVQTGLSQNMGSVSAGLTKKITIETLKPQLASSSVIFFLTWTSGKSGTDQRGATYNAITCNAPTPTATPTPLPTLTPTTEPSSTPVPTQTPTPTNEPTPSRTPTSEPSPTPLPHSTYFNLEVFLHGIGSGGDNVNPAAKGNQEPVHATLHVQVNVTDSKNDPVLSGSGDVEYSSQSGSFKGNINMGTDLTDGAYLIKIKADKYLRAATKILNIKAGQENNIAPVSLIAGDINNDNAVNILDFNLLTLCYSDLKPAKDCPDTDAADLTDDGDVNQFDYNLFLRELSNQGGE